MWSTRVRSITSSCPTNLLKTIKVEDRVDDYSHGLSLERQFVVERLNLIKKQNDFETMVLKENVNMQDISWVESHSLEFPELRVELQPQRFYPLGRRWPTFWDMLAR
jgi:cell division protein FtsI/penicillin-binding protein 2